MDCPSPAVSQAFEKSQLFCHCVPEQTRFFLRDFAKGSEISGAPEGDPAVGLVITGRVQVYSISADGTSVNLSTLNPGESFGISTIFTEAGLTTRLYGDKKATIAYFPRTEFLRLLEENSQMLLGYAYLCNQKISYLTQKIQFLTMPSCRRRLVVYLLKNQTPQGEVFLDISKERLAKVIGVSRASLFRELRRLSDAGLISAEGKSIQLLALASLEQIVQETHDSSQ
ncbi:Crp/Fnr family transcriptional regulator [Oscillospiraceae bacterium MB08-C2-2]|nr:Crp/Fnr family transcriptional regulator [Oscillospiraceae bacterium MB08-C2-2]